MGLLGIQISNSNSNNQGLSIPENRTIRVLGKFMRVSDFTNYCAAQSIERSWLEVVSVFSGHSIRF